MINERPIFTLTRRDFLIKAAPVVILAACEAQPSRAPDEVLYHPGIALVKENVPLRNSPEAKNDQNIVSRSLQEFQVKYGLLFAPPNVQGKPSEVTWLNYYDNDIRTWVYVEPGNFKTDEDRVPMAGKRGKNPNEIIKSNGEVLEILVIRSK